MGLGASTPVVSSRDLGAGDLILVRAQVATPLGVMDPGVLRAVASSQRSTYFATQEKRLAGAGVPLRCCVAVLGA